MTTPYTKTAALRLIPIAKTIEAVREFKNCIQVTYWVANGGRCSTFLSKKAFIEDAANIRESGAAAVEVIETHDDEYVVKSKDSYYIVRPNQEDLNQRCECGDCHYRGVACKHQVAVEQFKSQGIGDRGLVIRESCISPSPIETPTTAARPPQIEVTKEVVFAAGFGWMPIKKDLDPVEIFYSKHRVQVWKLGSRYWGTYGHFWIVDSQAGAVVAVVQANARGCWQSADIKRDSYMRFLAEYNNNDYNRNQGRTETHSVGVKDPVSC